MNIKDYTGYFHDGSIHEIKHLANGIEILMESCEILPEWNVQTQLLSKFRTIAGSLILSGVDKITINDEEVKELVMHYDDCEILDFEISETNVELSVIWRDFSVQPYTSEYNDIIIYTEKFEWKINPKIPENYKD